jgi:hypothetical protein
MTYISAVAEPVIRCYRSHLVSRGVSLSKIVLDICKSFCYNTSYLGKGSSPCAIKGKGISLRYPDRQPTDCARNNRAASPFKGWDNARGRTVNSTTAFRNLSGSVPFGNAAEDQDSLSVSESLDLRDHSQSNPAGALLLTVGAEIIAPSKEEIEVSPKPLLSSGRDCSPKPFYFPAGACPDKCLSRTVASIDKDERVPCQVRPPAKRGAYLKGFLVVPLCPDAVALNTLSCHTLPPIDRESNGQSLAVQDAVRGHAMENGQQECNSSVSSATRKRGAGARQGSGLAGRGRGRPRKGSEEVVKPIWTAEQQRQFKLKAEASKVRGNVQISVSVVSGRLVDLLGLIEKIPPSVHGERAFMLARQACVCFHADMEWLVEHSHFETGAGEVLRGDEPSSPRNDPSESPGTLEACSLDGPLAQRYREKSAIRGPAGWGVVHNRVAEPRSSSPGREADSARALALSQSGGDCKQLHGGRFGVPDTGCLENQTVTSTALYFPSLFYMTYIVLSYRNESGDEGVVGL